MSGPAGMVGLSEALIALRRQLLAAWQEGEEGGADDGRPARLRFRIAEPIELTFQAAVTKDLSGSGGVRWWLFSLGGEASRSTEATQTVHMKISPVMYGPDGQVTDTVEIDSVR